MTIEGLGNKFQEARIARGLTLDEAARMTKIRPSRLAEIEADDFSQFPSLAYAKGFLQIYGKFLDVDVAPYLEAFETSESVTVDGYSYLQEEPAPAPARTPVVRRRPSRPAAPSRPSSSSPGERPSLMPLVIGIVVIVVGFWLGKLLVNLRRLAPQTPRTSAAVTPAQQPAATTAPLTTVAPFATTVQSPPPQVQQQSAATNQSAFIPAPATSGAATVAPTEPPVVAASMPGVAVATPPSATPPPAAPKEPEVRRAQPVRAEDLASAKPAEPAGSNRIAIRPLKKTYIKVVVDHEQATPAFERWVSPADGTLEFRGDRVAIRVLDRDAVQIKKNGKSLTDADSDVTIE
jgi:cytoskeletal protein RodZ